MTRNLLMLFLALTTGAACSSNNSSYNGGGTTPTPTPIPSGPSTVLIPNSTAFNPTTLTVATGTTVTWGNNDSILHTSTSDTGLWDSAQTLSAGKTFTHKFDTAGSFKYHCTIHANMTGTIVVQ